MITGQSCRGVIYSAHPDHVGEQQFYVVVSNNGPNHSLDTAPAARITTSRTPQISSIIPIESGAPVHASVLCDDIELLYPEDARNSPGAFSPAMMRRINDGLRAAFAL